MKLQIEIDQKSFDWLSTLLQNSKDLAEKKVNNNLLFDSYPFIVAWLTAFTKATNGAEPTIADLAEAVAKMDAPIVRKSGRKPAKTTKTSKKKVQTKEEKEAEAAAVYTCSVHNNYHGLRSPRTLDCSECWELYQIRNGVVKANDARQRLSRKIRH